jgi:hypothetical protein
MLVFQWEGFFIRQDEPFPLLYDFSFFGKGTGGRSQEPERYLPQNSDKCLTDVPNEKEKPRKKRTFAAAPF